MTSKITKQVGSFLVITFILWYLLRRTALGSAYAQDMWAIPKFLNISEGLQSAQKYLER